MHRRRVRVELYGKPGCPPCDRAAEILERLSQEWPIEWEKVNVAEDPDAAGLYGEMVPVVFVDGVLCMAGKVSELRLRRELMRHVEAPQA